MVLWEITALQRIENPFCGLAEDVFVDRVHCGLRPSLEHTEKQCQSILAQCWHLDPDRRPTAKQLVQQLQNLQQTNTSGVCH